MHNKINIKRIKPGKIYIHFLIILVMSLHFVTYTFCNVTEALSVFPGAEGFGADTVAGSGRHLDPVATTVYKVTNLDASGPGSLKEAIDATGPRVVIFEVSGIIDLTPLGGWGLWVKNPYITIAGQTAPSPGIMLTGATFIVETHDVLIQHIRSRPGDVVGTTSRDNPSTADAMQVLDIDGDNTTYNVFLDHISLSWSIDEVFSTWYSNVHDVTIRNSIMSEPLNNSVHPKGPHGYGSLVGPGEVDISMIGNLASHSFQRNPLIKEGTTTLIVNNLIYNYGQIATHAAAHSSLKSSIVGNVYIKGVNSSTINPIHLYNADNTASVYVDDNEYDGSVPGDPWSIVTIKPAADLKAVTPPVPLSGLTVKPSNEVKDWVLDNVGARPADRDSVDLRIINDVINGTGQIINSVSDVGGLPTLTQNTRALTIPNNPNGDDDGDGYTNLEEWLHTFAASVEGAQYQPDTEVPSVPGNLSATSVSSTQIDLSWNASTDNIGVLGYKVYRDGIQIDTTTAISYSDSVLYSSTTYNYNISAYDGTGNESGQSATASATTLTGTTTTVFSTIDAYTGDALNWQPLTPSRWEVISDGGNLRYGINTTSYSNLSGNRLGEYSLIRNRTYNDFTLTAKIKSTDDLTTNSSADYDIVFGYQDPNNYYYMMFSSGSANSNLFKVVNGTRQWIADSTNLAVPDNAYHDIKLERTGSTIKVYFDNILKLNAADSTFATGGVGIGSYNDASLWDDIIINGNGNDPTSPPTGLTIIE